MVLPGGEVTLGPWHIILICDCSGAMLEKGKIDELNRIIQHFISTVKIHQEKFSFNSSVKFGVIRYSSGAEWHIPFATPIEDVTWMNLSAGGESDLGAGLRLVSRALLKQANPKRERRPLLILISTSGPTDECLNDVNHYLDEYKGDHPQCYAIAIGQNAPVGILTEFSKNMEYPYFIVKNPAQLKSSMETILRLACKQLDEDAEIASDSLHFYLIVDCSDSMNSNGKIQQLNNAIKEALPAMKAEADNHPGVRVFLHSIRFSDGAKWVEDQPVPLKDFRWPDLTAGGKRDLGAALDLVAKEMQRIHTSQAIPPVLVLITDGSPTDDYKEGLKKLREQPLAVKAVRIAIAIGSDADRGVLNEFAGKTGVVLEANSAQGLVKYIRWTSVDIPGKINEPKRLPQVSPEPEKEPADPKRRIMKIFSDLPLKSLSDDPDFFIMLLGMECGKNPSVFERLFSLLRDSDPEMRSLASDTLGERPDSLETIINIYRENISRDPQQAVLAGRVLGRKSVKMVSQEHPMIHADNTRMFFGIPVAFAPCVCGHCGAVNDGIPVPEKGLYIGYYGQKDTERGEYFLPVLCDFCGKTFFIAWDTDPRY